MLGPNSIGDSMKKLFFVSLLMASSMSFAGFWPKCQSGEYDKWGYCTDESPGGQFSYHIGTAYCLKPCKQSFEEMVGEAQSNAQQAANEDRLCGYKNVRSSDWETPIASESTEGQRTWVQVKTSARFTCEWK